MKTFSQRFLKGALAILLVVVMLFGSTISGFAAVVDNADTKANVDVASTAYNISSNVKVYYLDTASWGASQMYIWKDSGGYNTYYTLSKIANTEIYYYNFGGGWNGYSGFKFRSDTNWSKQSSGDIKHDITASSWYYGTSTSKSTSLTNMSGDAEVVTMVSTDGGSTYQATASSDVITKVSGYSLTTAATSATSTNASTSSSANYATIKAAYGSTITYTASPGTHTFKGFSTTSSSTLPSMSSTSNTYTRTASEYNGTANTTIYAYYIVNNGYSYTVSAGTGGTVNTTGGTGTTATITAEPDTGYEFAGWEVTGNGSVADPSSASTTLTINANGVIAHATFKKLTYTVRFFDGETQIGESQTVEYDDTAVAPALPTKDGYTSSWDKAYTNIKADTDVYVKYTANPYSVEVSADPEDGGTVTINGSTTTPQTVDYDSSVTVLATPNEGYKFLGWYENGSTKVSDDASYTFTCKGDISLVAKFGPKVYTITTEVSPAGAGTATVNGQSSVTVDYNISVNLVATVNDGYKFDGWYLGDTKKSSETTYSVSATDDVTYTAKFNKIWDVTVKVPTGVTKVSFAGGSTTADKIYEDITDGTVVNNFEATTAVDYKLVGWEVTKNGETETFNETSIDVTVDADTTITPVVEKLYYAIVAGNTATANDYYEVGETVTLTFDVETGEYLTGVTVAPSMELDVDINKDAGSVTFTMPQVDVTLTPQYGDMYKVEFSADVFTSTTNKGYYYPGQAVTINVTPKGGHLITAVTSEQTEVTYANKVITFTMPAENVTLDVEYSASFKAYSKTITVHIDRDGPNNSTYDNTVQGGTVKMTCNGATLADGGFADGDVTYTATVNTNYQFVGFFADKDCNRLLSTSTTYTVSPESDLTVYALYARKQYIKLVGYSYYEMTYDYKLKAYTYDYTSSNLGTAFNNAFDIRVTYDKNNDTVYSTFDGNVFQVTMNQNAIGRTISWGKAVWNVNAKQANTELPMKLIVKPGSLTQHNKIDVSAQATKIGHDVILSSGRYKIGDANTTITTEGVTGTHVTPGGHNGDNEEYKKIYLSESKTLSWELEIGADNYSSFTDDMATGTYVESFVVYKMRSKTFEIVEPVSLGNNKYQGTVIIDEDCYIVPIFFHTEEYNEKNGLISIELYFDASAIQHLNWGPFVAAYAWGSNNDEYFGEWPGQMLIPSEDGKSFYTQLDVPAAGSANPASGITFNNYLFKTAPTCEQGLFGLGETNVQTYDYREAITLYEAGYEVITFVAKDSEDGYHGDSSDGSNSSNTISSSTTGIKDNYTFDYLYCRDGVTPMDFTGNPVTDTEGATVDDITNADYYVVTKGDVIYYAGNYSADSTYNGDWCVDWYIFDSNGTYKTKVLSTALWHDTDLTDDVHQTVLMTALGLTPETAAGKTVAISYEAPNNCPKVNGHDDSHQIAYDGQWYGNMLEDSVTGNVIVGLDDGNGNFTIDTVDPTNEADYGSGYLKDLEGGLHQSLDIKIDYGMADLTASAETGYRFIGWYTKKADGTYVRINTNTSYSTYINMNETYYAIFRKLDKKEVSINHSIYVNPNDPAIPSHGGTGEMSFEVVETLTGKVVATGKPSLNRSSDVFTADEDTSYTIKIKTTPLMHGKFYAWYTDSLTASGQKTYEEILTEPYHKDSETTVEAQFEYVYDADNEDIKNEINIYSDILYVSNKATIIYQYRNRFNDICSYTVGNIELNNEECLGKTADGQDYAGNEGKKYVLTYLTYAKFVNADGDEQSGYYKNEDIEKVTEDFKAKGYELVETSNKLQDYAPDDKVTQAFNDEIRWVITSNKIDVQGSTIVVTATQGAPTYIVNYTKIDENGNRISSDEKGQYNTLMKITTAPTNAAGDKFSYWYDETNEEILCYTTYYNYRIVEDKTIKAVYGDTDLPNWTPSINSVTKTREFKDDGDIIYTDYLLAFNSKDSLILEEYNKEKLDDNKIKYGLMVYREADYYIEDSANIKYPEYNNNDIQSYLKKTAKEKEKNMAFTVDGTKYNCYFYGLTDKVDLTIFNRCDYYLGYDNNAVNTDADGNEHHFREYAFTAVAYIIVDGEVYLSNPKNVDFYELGNILPTEIGNN